jgi:hypothetical protein
MQDEGHGPASGCLLRLFWLFLGNVALALVAARILFRAEGLFSLLDAIYWSLVVLLIAARYADIRYCRGATAEGKPASLRDWRRYAWILLLSAAAVWLTVCLVGAIRVAG